MPWTRKQAVAILAKARKKGDTRLAKKAKASIQGKRKRHAR